MKKYSILSFVLAGVILLSSCGSLEGQGSDVANSTSNEVTATEDTSAKSTEAPSEETSVQTDAETDEPSDFTYAPIEINRTINATHVALLDVEKREILFEKGGLDTKIYPASTTKLITALVALENCSPETVITAGNELSLMGEGSSIAYIKRGHKLTLDMLIAAMLLPSGNDAAYVVAAGVGKIMANDDSISSKEAVNYFCREMNSFASKNGLTGSNFTCPDGYHDDNHYTTLHDMLIISSLAVQNETILKYAKTESLSVTYASGEKNSWNNTNELIKKSSPYYYSYAIGLKTGTTTEAGKCLVSAAQKDGRTVIACVFNAEGNDDRFASSLLLLKTVLGGK